MKNIFQDTLGAWRGTWLAMLLAGAAGTALAQPIKDIILNDAVVRERSGCATVRIQFNFPLRYKRHFPYDSGDDLRIHIDPILHTSEGHEIVFEREAVRVENEDLLPLINVIYDGQTPGGPYLTLHFSETVRFAVAQGKDYRSLIVSVAATAGTDPETCLGDGEETR